MWSTHSEPLPNTRGMRLTFTLRSQPASVADVLHGWRTDAGFRSLFNALLADVPYPAFRWETPGVTSRTLDRPFECVLLEADGLDRRPDPEAFAEQFAETPGSVATFPNLSGDAILVVPCPVAEPSVYGHLAAFVRRAPDDQRHALWQAVGDAMAARVGDKPVWLSTAGAGVSWLHVRLDDRPKYFHHDPYRSVC